MVRGRVLHNVIGGGVTSFFTDTGAALEEAEYLAKLTQVSHCLVKDKRDTSFGIRVVTKEEAKLLEYLILETVTPNQLFDIYEQE